MNTNDVYWGEYEDGYPHSETLFWDRPLHDALARARYWREKASQGVVVYQGKRDDRSVIYCRGDELGGDDNWMSCDKCQGTKHVDTSSGTMPCPSCGRIDEGIAPLSHDSSLERAIRKHKTPRSRRHMQGSDRYRVADPAKKVKARLKRVSRHQPRPEIDEAFNFIMKYQGKPIAESDLRSVNDSQLLSCVADLLSAMCLGGWQKCEQGITNGHYIIENENYGTIGGQLTYNNKLLKLDWNWLYSLKDMLGRIVREQSDWTKNA